MAKLIELIYWLFVIAIFARVMLSWLPGAQKSQLSVLIYQITEPILAPLRRFLPRLGAFDLAPMAALILLAVIRSVLVRLLTG